MPRIISGSILTQLDGTDLFGAWPGAPLFTNVTVSSLFTAEVVKSVQTPLVLTSTFSASTNAKRTLTTTLIEKSVFGGSVLNLHYLNTPIPDLSNPPVPDPPADLPHNFVDEGKLVPTDFKIYFQGTPLLFLNAPEFGDTEALRTIQVKEYTRGNTLITYRNLAWGDQKIFEYNFAYMQAIQKEAMSNVFRIFLGRKLTIIDHLGITRLGFILTPESEIFESVPRGFSANFKFQQVD